MADILGLGSLFNAGASIYTNHRNIQFQQQANEQNIQLQRDINQQNIDNQWQMWNATNEYNSPAAQMARYREAGLNPNLIYGQSNTAQSSNLGVSSAPQVQAKKLDPIQGMNIASQYLDLLSKRELLSKQQHENKLADAIYQDVVEQSSLNTTLLQKKIDEALSHTANMDADTLLKEAEHEIKNIEKQIQSVNLKIRSNDLSLSNSQVDMIPLAKEKAQLENSLLTSKIYLTRLEQQEKLTNNRLTQIKIKEVRTNIKKLEADIQHIGASTLESEARKKNLLIDYDNKFIELNDPFAKIPIVNRVTNGIGKIGLSLFKAFKFNY